MISIALLRVPACLLALCLALGAFPALGQESQDKEESEGGGLFGGLKKMLPKSAQALTDKLDSAVDSAVDAGKKRTNQLLDSVSDAEAKKNEILAYLDEKLAGRSSSVTDAQAQAYTREILPLIEAINDRKFTNPPRVVVASYLPVIQALAQDLVPQFEKLEPGVSTPLIYLQAYLTAALWAPALLGKYSYSTDTVYLLPANLDALMKEKGLNPALENDILKLVIGHELTHALQDQEVGLKRIILKANSKDGLSATNATVEGHGMFAEKTLARQMHLETASEELDTLMRAEDLEDDAWVFERIAHVQAVQLEQTYAGGEKFVEYHYRKGGMPAVWDLLMAPPQRSSMISQPETYTTTPPPLPDYEVKFMPLKGHLPDSLDWAFSAGTSGDFKLRGILSSLDHATRERIMQNLVEDAYVTMPHKTKLNREVDLTLFKFKNEQEARVMGGALEKIALQKHKDMDRNSRLRLRDMQRQPYALAGKPAGIEWHYETDVLLLGKTSTTEIIEIQGTSIAMFSESGSGLSRTQIEAMLGEAFTIFNAGSPVQSPAKTRSLVTP